MSTAPDISVEPDRLYPLVHRRLRPTCDVVRVRNDLPVGTRGLVIIAGPCAVESRNGIREAARDLKSRGAHMLRGGAFKPRTSPHSFQGLGKEGLRFLREAREETGLPIITELMDARELDIILEVADVIQIGSRNMQNYSLLKAVSCTRKPVLLKRAMSATVDEWLQAAEYLLCGGNDQVILCERGIRTFEPRTRNTLDLSAIPLVKSLANFPVIVDPSHGTGLSEIVIPMALAAIAAGADGLMVEVHPHPESACSDGRQSLTPDRFSELIAAVQKIAPAVDRELLSAPDSARQEIRHAIHSP